MFTPAQLAARRAVLLEKMKRYTVDWPSASEPPVHLRLKQKIAVPYVRRALEKINEGTYGVCDSCGCDIPLERLDAVIGAIRCVDCESTRV